MILLSFDVETTGLNVVDDRVIELGAILYSTAQHKCLESQGMLVKTELPIIEEITAITGIHPAAVERFGYESDTAFENLIGMYDMADAVIGYNVRRFDRRVFENWAKHIGQSAEIAERPDKPWIDLFYDLPWRVPIGKLSHVAADHGILNLFPHSALADAQTVLAIAGKYDIDTLLARAQSPVVVLQARAERSQNDLVKKAKFRWNPTNRIWWKSAKQQDVDEIIQSVSFPVTVEKGWTPEDLEN